LSHVQQLAPPFHATEPPWTSVAADEVIQNVAFWPQPRSLSILISPPAPCQTE
jgi:hypothetical protein